MNPNGNGHRGDIHILSVSDFSSLGYSEPEEETAFLHDHPVHANRIPRFLMEVYASNHPRDSKRQGKRLSPEIAHEHIFKTGEGCRWCKHHLKALLDESKRLLFEVSLAE